MKLNAMLKVRINDKELDAFKDRCSDVGVKYTVVIRNMIQNIGKRLSDEQIKLLGKK